MHGRLRVHRDEGFRRWWAVVQGAVGPVSVAVEVPVLNEDLGFAQGVEDLAVKQLFVKSGVKTFAIPVL